MSEGFKPAENLSDAVNACELTPLDSDDPRYQDFSCARDFRLERIVKELKTVLDGNKYFHQAICGHRGCGKSTEILRLQNRIQENLGIHAIYVRVNEETNPNDIQYSELFLVLAKTLEEEFRDTPYEPDKKKLDNVANWFKEITKITDEVVEKSVGIKTEASGGAAIPFFGKVMATLSAMASAGSKAKTEIRDEIQKYPVALVNNLNLLIDDVHAKMRAKGEKKGVMFILDNIDRYQPNVVNELLMNGGDFLRELRCHIMITLPIDLVYKQGIQPSDVFQDCRTLPMIKIRSKTAAVDDISPEALKAMKDALSKRFVIDKIFKEDKLADTLIKASGGSIRDLMRLVKFACNAAEEIVDESAVNEAIRRLRLDYSRRIGEKDFERLAKVHIEKHVPNDEEHRELIYSRLVLEYVNDETWNDIHPVLHGLSKIRECIAQLRAEKASQQSCNGNV